MLTGHRRYLLREATGPTAGEVEAGDVNVLVGAFSDAQMYEDPWTKGGGPWTPTSWEPATQARASAKPYNRVVRGEAIPYMIGAVKIGALDASGDLRLYPAWTQPDRETWEPRGLGDFRTSEVYSGQDRGKYRGEAIPYMVGALPGLGTRRGAGADLPGARKAEIAKDQARPTFRARKTLLEWAAKNRMTVLQGDFAARSPDGTLAAYGALFQLPSTNDRIQVANKAKEIALFNRTFYNMVRLGSGAGHVLLYFTDDPAGFLVTGQGDLSYVGFLGMFGKKDPKEKLEKLEAKYKSWKSGEKKPGPFDSEERLLKRINKLRSELGMPELDESGEETKAEGLIYIGNVDDEAGRGFRGGGRRVRLRKKKKKKKQKKQKSEQRQQKQQQQQQAQPQIIVIDRGGDRGGDRDFGGYDDDEGGDDDMEED